MPFPRPSLEELKDRIAGDLDANLPDADSRLPRSVLNALVIMLAGAAHLLYGFIAFISEQLFLDTAAVENLDRIADFWGLERTDAQFADGPVRFTGTDTTIIPIDTLVQRSDGVQYATIVEVEMGSITTGQVDVLVQAVLAGVIANTEATVILSLVSPISGIDSDVTVITDSLHLIGIENGVDEESDDALRARISLRIQDPPQGGAIADYEQNMLAVAGVTRVWIRPNNRGLGTVDGFFVRDGDGTGSAIIPDSAEVQIVQDAIDPVKPVTNDYNAVAPIALDMDVEIGLLPNTTVVQEAVEAELEDMLFREAEPGDGVALGTITLAKISEAISVAQGEDNHRLILVQGITPADVVPGAAELVILGAVTYEDF